MSKCRSCGAEVVWCMTTRGKRIRIDGDDMGGWEVPLEVPDGNVRMTGRRDRGTPIVEVVADGIFQVAERRYRAHFLSCPDADEWRK